MRPWPWPTLKDRLAHYAELRANGWQRVPLGTVAELAALSRRWDLDSMTAEQLAAFRPEDNRSFTKWARGVFYPYRPGGYLGAAKQLRTMAALRHKALHVRRRPGVWLADYEKRYRQLPAFAQWRTQFNVLACVQDGKKFRKRPRKKG